MLCQISEFVIKYSPHSRDNEKHPFRVGRGAPHEIEGVLCNHLEGDHRVICNGHCKDQNTVELFHIHFCKMFILITGIHSNEWPNSHHSGISRSHHESSLYLYPLVVFPICIIWKPYDILHCMKRYQTIFDMSLILVLIDLCARQSRWPLH